MSNKQTDTVTETKSWEIYNWAHDKRVFEEMEKAPKFDDIFEAAKYFYDKKIDIMLAKRECSNKEHAVLYLDTQIFHSR
jgi:hypothetical protein